jgi:hypothetical protein
MILLAAICLILAGCTKATATNQTTPTATPTIKTPIPPLTAIPTIETLVPSLSPFPTITPIPTLAAEDAYSRLLELLQNNLGCSLPCLWGITPGISTISDVQNLILPFAGVAEYSRLPSNIFGGMIFNIPMKDDSRISIFLSYYPSPDSQTISAVLLGTQAFHNDGDPNQDQSFYGSDLYTKMLNSYTLHGILSTYGVPSEVLVFVEPSAPKYFNLRILYPEKGIFISYGTFVEKQGGNYLGCPSNMFISLYLLPSNSGNTYQQILPTIGPDWGNVYPKSDFKSLDEAVHMSLDDFYQTFKNPTNRCLETPMLMWDRP